MTVSGYYNLEFTRYTHFSLEVRKSSSPETLGSYWYLSTLLTIVSHPKESSFSTFQRHENLTSHTDCTASAIYRSVPKCS